MESVVRQIPVLVVDDDEVARSALVHMLGRIGFQMIEEAEDGTEALAQVAAARPAVILLDIHMRPMDGLTFLTRLRYHDEKHLRDIPVIMLTSERRGAAVTVANQLDVSAYLVKPASTLELQIAAEKALGIDLV